MTRLERWCRRQVVSRLNRLKVGSITLCDGEARRRFGQSLPSESFDLELHVRRPRFFRRVALGGSLGAAEAYMDGDWTTDDLPGLLSLFARDAAVPTELDRRWRFSRRPALRVWSWLRRNTPGGSRKNIAAHYDLSNDFYQLWLDETMAYSSAIFLDESASLADASRHKFDLICQKLALKPDDHLLEIGTGWGGFAVYAAENYGCRVTTTTISDQQYQYTRRLIAERGLESRVTLLDRDYRDLTGQYDKLSSIEMIEAVGHEFLHTYFAKCNDLLRPGGRLVLQAITIPDQRYEAYRRSVDFIQRHIFPGGALPSLGAIHEAIGENTALLLTHLDDYSAHYARTLTKWRERFFDHLQEIRRLGFDERFIRTWDYYLAYCIAGFQERQIGLAQLVFDKQS